MVNSKAGKNDEAVAQVRVCLKRVATREPGHDGFDKVSEYFLARCVVASLEMLSRFLRQEDQVKNKRSLLSKAALHVCVWLEWIILPQAFPKIG